jgi:hypothetical protein
MLNNNDNNFLNLIIGSMYCVDWNFGATYIEKEATQVIDLYSGDIFLLLYFKEIKEINVIEFEILFENKQMYFNIPMNYSNIDNVRRAASYDIPFVILQESEPGSNNSIS